MDRFEGVVLHSIDYRDYDQILTVFTPQAGLLKILAYGAKRTRKSKGSGTPSLLVKGEFVCKKGKGDLYVTNEFTQTQDNLGLRERIEVLEGAVSIVRALRNSQYPEKPAPDLYAMLDAYLRYLPSASNPPSICGSFKLKILRHEGVFELKNRCAACGSSLEEAAIFEGEPYCRAHAPCGASLLNREETDSLLLLAYGRFLHLIDQAPLSPRLETSIEQWFGQHFSVE